MEVPGRTRDSLNKDDTGKSSDEDGGIFCQPCSSGGDTVVAIGYCRNCNEYMCAVCLKVHRRQAMSRNHNILDGDNMPKVTLPKVSLNACCDLCLKHVNEIIKYYCSSHEVVGCGDCMVIDHKACKVDRIQDISKEYFNGIEHHGLMKKVDQFATCMDKIKKNLLTNEKNTKQAYDKAAEDVRKFKRETIDYLDKAEREMLESIAKMEKRDDSLILKLKQDEKRIDGDIKELQTKLQLQQNQANKLFVEAKHVKAKLCSIEEDIAQLKKEESTIDLHKFHRSSHISQIIDSGLKFGEMSTIIGETGIEDRRRESNDEFITSTVRQANLEETNIPDMNAFFECEINIKLQDDAADCAVFDCALISQNQIIIADYDNTCIKIVDVKNKTISKYKLRSQPSGVAVVDSNMIAVTLQDNNIQFLAITDCNKINERNMITINRCCDKIAICEDKIIGITRNTVEVLSMRGQTIKSISHPKLKNLMDIAVVPSSQMFYVSKTSLTLKTSVHKFDFDGNLIATYQDKERGDVKGLEVTRDGTVLVCNWNKYSINMITPDCKKIKVLVKQNEHVRSPVCVAFCNETNKLFLVNNDRFLSKKLKIFIKVFQLK